MEFTFISFRGIYDAFGSQVASRFSHGDDRYQLWWLIINAFIYLCLKWWALRLWTLIARQSSFMHAAVVVRLLQGQRGNLCSINSIKIESKQIEVRLWFGWTEHKQGIDRLAFDLEILCSMNEKDGSQLDRYVSSIELRRFGNHLRRELFWLREFRNRCLERRTLLITHRMIEFKCQMRNNHWHPLWTREYSFYWLITAYDTEALSAPPTPLFILLIKLLINSKGFFSIANWTSIEQLSEKLFFISFDDKIYWILFFLYFLLNANRQKRPFIDDHIRANVKDKNMICGPFVCQFKSSDGSLAVSSNTTSASTKKRVSIFTVEKI